MGNKKGRLNVAALLQKYRSEEVHFCGYVDNYVPRSKYVFEILPVNVPEDLYFLHFRLVRRLDSFFEDVMFFKFPRLNYEEESFIHPDLILKEKVSGH